jgi:hypothetical protein
MSHGWAMTISALCVSPSGLSAGFVQVGIWESSDFLGEPWTPQMQSRFMLTAMASLHGCVAFLSF